MNKADTFHNQITNIASFKEWKQLEELQQIGAQQDKIDQKISEVIVRLKEIEGFNPPSKRNMTDLAYSVIFWLRANLGNLSQKDNDSLNNISKIFSSTIGIERISTEIGDITKLLESYFSFLKEQISEKSNDEIIDLINGNILNLYQKSFIMLKLYEVNKKRFGEVLGKIELEPLNFSLLDDIMIPLIINQIDKKDHLNFSKIVLFKGTPYYSLKLKKITDCLDEEDILNLAKIMIKKTPWESTDTIQEFMNCGLDKKHLGSLAEYVAENHSSIFIQDLHEFIELGLDISKNPYFAKKIAEKDPSIFAENIQKFRDNGLTESEVPNLAKIVVENSAASFVRYIHDFVDNGLDGKEIPSLAKIVLEKDPDVFEDCIKDFIDCCPKSEIPNLGKLVAEINPEIFIEYIEELTLDLNKKEISDLVIIVVRSDPSFLPEFLEKAELDENEFIKQFPEFEKHITLSKIAILIKSGNSEEALARFSSLRDQEDFLEYLKLTVESYTRVTQLLIEEWRENIMEDIEKLGIKLEELAAEKRLSFLPILSPQLVRQTLLEFPKQERAAWLSEEITYDQFIGSITDVLNEIKTLNLDQETDENLNSIASVIEEVSKTVPLKALGAMAEDQEHFKTLAPFIPFMDSTRLSVVIPMVAKEEIVQHLSTMPTVKHLAYVAYFTEEQKEYYLDQFDLTPQEVKNWNGTDKNKYQAIPKEKDEMIALEKEWNLFFPKINQALTLHLQTLNQLRSKLLQFNPSIDINTLLGSKIDEINRLKSELKDTSEKIQKNILEMGARVDIPDKFICLISREIMTEPYKDQWGKVCQKEVFEHAIVSMGNKNPFNRASMTVDDLSLDTELKAEIDAFLIEHPEVLD